jgi:hypothetical protein
VKDRAKLLAFLEERCVAVRLRGDGTGTLMFAIYQGLASRVERGDFDEEVTR